MSNPRAAIQAAAPGAQHPRRLVWLLVVALSVCMVVLIAGSWSVLFRAAHETKTAGAPPTKAPVQASKILAEKPAPEPSSPKRTAKTAGQPMPKITAATQPPLWESPTHGEPL